MSKGPGNVSPSNDAHIAILDEKGVIAEVNDAWRAFCQENDCADEHAFVGQNYLDACQSVNCLAAPEEDLVVTALKQVLAGERPIFTHEYTCHAPHEQRWFELIATPRTVDGEAGAQIAHVPITARKEAEYSLRQSEEQLRLVADSFPLLICYLDRARCFRFANLAFTDWLGKPLDVLLGTTAAQVFSPAHYDLIRPLLDRAYAGEQARDQGHVAFPDGTARYVTRRFVPHVSDDGIVLGVFFFIQDITDIKAADEHLRQAQKMEALGELAGGIAHDFNNLLAVITGEAELLKRGLGDAPKHIEALLSASHLGASTARQLLTFSRQHDADPVASDLNALVTRWAESLGHALGETIEVECQLQPDIDQVMVDPVSLELALLNLAINARDAMPEGGKLLIETGAGARRGGNAENADRAVLTMTDTGTGMSPEVMEHAFEPFFTTKPAAEGSGLGLAAVHGFAVQSGGKITVDSEVGKGTSVRLYLPYADTPALQDKAADTEDLPSAEGEVVLLVEDEERVRTVTLQMLEALGYRVLEAKNGASALPVIEGGTTIDLLLSDVVLPGGLSGPAVAQNAKETRRDIEILFMSGYADTALADHDLPDDATVIKKPFTMSELAHQVHAALHR